MDSAFPDTDQQAIEAVLARYGRDEGIRFHALPPGLLPERLRRSWATGAQGRKSLSSLTAVHRDRTIALCPTGSGYAMVR